MTARVPVAVLGATGAVGQKFVRLLAGHPWFRIAALCASERNTGRRYADAVRWLEPVPLPDECAAMELAAATPDVPGTIAFSALDAEAAARIEPAFAEAGWWVVTNTRTFRMEPDVPLLIPEVNAHQLDLLETQRRGRGWAGGIVANPNCSAIVLAGALAPLARVFDIQAVVVTTLQAVSGAGYPGTPSLDILGNAVPFIGGEEDKIEAETRKILGTDMPISAHATRVPVVDGHLLAVSVGLDGAPPLEAIGDAFRTFTPVAEVRELPSAPDRFLVLDEAPDRPQPRLDAGRGGGMTISVGRLRACPVLTVRFVALGHNTIRGAAGAALLNAELLIARGLVERRG